MDTVRLILVIIMMVCAAADAVLAFVFVRWTKQNGTKTLAEVYPQMRAILTVFITLIVCMLLLYLAFIAAKIYI